MADLDFTVAFSFVGSMAGASYYLATEVVLPNLDGPYGAVFLGSTVVGIALEVLFP